MIQPEKAEIDGIVFVQWCGFVSTAKNRRGDRFFKKGFAQWIPC